MKERFAKYREVLAYLFFGVLATVLNIALYALFQALFGYAAANSWGNVLDNCICILFAYWTNRTWVFASRTSGRQALAEFGKFVTCRLGTMVLDAAIMMIGGNLLGEAGAALLLSLCGGALAAATAQKLWGMGVKILSNVVVVVLNYLFSKLLIFRKSEKKTQ
jgi:putative flippase GtrA